MRSPTHNRWPMNFVRTCHCLVIALACTIFLAALPAEAQEDLTVLDTSGITRASSIIEQPATVEFDVVGADGLALDGTEVTLTSESGEILTAYSVNGTVVFENVPAGVWTVASTQTGVVFTSVAIQSAVAGGLALGTAGTIGAVVVGGGAIAGAVSLADDDDNNDPMSPSS